MRAVLLALAAMAALLAAGPGGAAPAAKIPLTVTNSSGKVLMRLHVAPKQRLPFLRRRGPGPDILGAGTVATGETVVLEVDRTRGCRFDVTAVMDDASLEWRHNLDLCKEGALRFDPRQKGAPGTESLAPGGLFLINDTPDAVLHLYVWDEAAAGSDEDLMQGSILEPRGADGTWSTRTFLAGTEWSCEVWVKVVLSGATGTVQRRFDLCSGESFHILYPPQSGYEAPPRPERPRGLPYCPGDPRCKKKKPVG